MKTTKKKSHLKQALIEGLLSTSQAFQRVKSHVNVIYASIDELRYSIQLFAHLLTKHAEMLDRHENDLNAIKTAHYASMLEMQKNSIDTRLPRIDKTNNDVEEKPN